MKLKPSPAVAISLVALFFSLTGAGFAASRYIITSTHQIKPSVLRRLQGATGAQGPAGQQGATGQQGVTGAQGSPDFTKEQFVRSSTEQFASPNGLWQASAQAACPPGYAVLTGGFVQSNVTITASWQPPGTQLWDVDGQINPDASTGTLQAWVTCVPAN